MCCDWGARTSGMVLPQFEWKILLSVSKHLRKRLQNYTFWKPPPVAFLPLAHLGSSLGYWHALHVLSVVGLFILKDVHLSVRLSVHPALVTAMQPTIFNRFCLYLEQPLILEEHEPYLLWGLYVYFLVSCGTLKFYEYTDWLVFEACACDLSAAHNIE